MLVLAQSSLEASQLDAVQHAAATASTAATSIASSTVVETPPAPPAAPVVVDSVVEPTTVVEPTSMEWPSVPRSDVFEEGLEELDMSSNPMPMFPLATARTLGARERRQSASNALVATEQHPLQ